MSERMVRHVIDLSKPPVLTERQKEELDALKNRPDSEIDYSEIPPLTEKFWQNAVRNPFFHPPNTPLIPRPDKNK